MECWGAQGGGYSTTLGGKGAYCSGILSISQACNIYIYIGGCGHSITSANTSDEFNGGGLALYQDGYQNRRWYGSGGGATDIRLTNGNWNDFNSLKSRIMVAAGGGGMYYTSERSGAESCNGGYGGALTGGNGTSIVINWGTGGTGGTQTTSGYDHGSPETDARVKTGVYNKGRFGKGGGGTSYLNEGVLPSSGGGGGWYGGGGSAHVNSGGGGSSFISGHTGCNAISSNSTASSITHTGSPNHYSGYVFTNTVMKAGNESMPSTTGGTETGHSGNGYCKITWHPAI